MENQEQLGQKSIIKLILSFSIPAIIGLLVNAAYNIVDGMFIGNVIGKDALAGVSISSPLMIIFFSFAMLVGIGGAANFAIKLGQKKQKEAHIIVNNTFILTIIIQASISILCFIFLDRILKLFGTTEAMHGYAVEYMRVILLGTVFQGVGFCLNGIIRALGKPKIAMATMLIGAIVNVVLDYLFIVIFNWGVLGAAIATVIGQFSSMIWLVYRFTRKESEFVLTSKYFRLLPKIVKKILLLGLSSCLYQLVFAMMVVIYNKLLLKHAAIELRRNKKRNSNICIFCV